MSTRRNLVYITGCAIAVGLLLIVLGRGPVEPRLESGTVPFADGNRRDYAAKDLIGTSADEVSNHALQYVQQHLIVHDTPQVLLVRPINQSDRPELGLGCPQAKLTVEEPPQSLVILKGDFDVSKAIRSSGIRPPWHFSYVAYIFDHWSGNHTTFIYSRNGEHFRIALNDPALPEDGPDNSTAKGPIVCPTQLPYRLQHYGEIAPTVALSIAPAIDSTSTPVTLSVTPAPSIPPVPTQRVPEPVPTPSSP